MPGLSSNLVCRQRLHPVTIMLTTTRFSGLCLSVQQTCVCSSQLQCLISVASHVFLSSLAFCYCFTKTSGKNKRKFVPVQTKLEAITRLDTGNAIQNWLLNMELMKVKGKRYILWRRPRLT